MVREYIITYKNGEQADCVTVAWLKMLTRFRRVKSILKRTIVNEDFVNHTVTWHDEYITKKDIKNEKE